MASFVTNDGAVLHFDRQGDGPAMVLVHGFASSGRVFVHQVDQFCSDFTVYTPDMRGHGRSAHVSHGARVARLGRDLHDLIESEGIDRVRLVGWSMGCAVIWSYLDLFGDDRIESYAFIDEIPYVLQDEECIGQEETVLDSAPLIGLQRRFAMAETRRAEVQGFIASMMRSVPDSDRAAILDDAAIAATPMGVGLLLDSNATDFRDVIPRLRRPTLFVAADQSVFRVAFHKWMHHVAPHSSLVVCRDAGHFLMVEQPETLNSALKAFFGDSLSQTAGRCRKSHTDFEEERA